MCYCISETLRLFANIYLDIKIRFLNITYHILTSDMNTGDIKTTGKLDTTEQRTCGGDQCPNIMPLSLRYNVLSRCTTGIGTFGKAFFFKY